MLTKKLINWLHDRWKEKLMLLIVGVVLGTLMTRTSDNYFSTRTVRFQTPVIIQAPVLIERIKLEKPQPIQAEASISANLDNKLNLHLVAEAKEEVEPTIIPTIIPTATPKPTVKPTPEPTPEAKVEAQAPPKKVSALPLFLSRLTI